jgi:oxygen-independent coproporphyrinogen III oxidase
MVNMAVFDGSELALSSDSVKVRKGTVHHGRIPSVSDNFGIYVHIPFCARKCSYCDFYSIEGTALKDRYLVALQQEISKMARRTTAGVVDSIYLGGGTPTMLSPNDIERILVEIESFFTIGPNAEITIEVNPGTVDGNTLRALLSLGINRLSIGVQSLDDSVLSFLGRIHTAREARACFSSAQQAGFGNISLDLIFAIPGQSRNDLKAVLVEALAMAPQHLAAYSLIVEEHTPLHLLVQNGQVRSVAEDEEAEQFLMTMAILEDAGYNHYEVSNYAKNGYRSRHNSSYWHHNNYLGFGPAAHSFWVDARVGDAWRWANVRQVSGYCDILSRQGSPVAMAEQLGTRELVNERIFLGLRSDGLSLSQLSSELGYEATGEQRAYIHQIVARGLAVLKDGSVRLTREGFLLCDEICAQLMIS